jgi:hypothetical protein
MDDRLRPEVTMRRPAYWLRTLPALLLFGIATSCSGGPGVEQAESAVADFHKKLDRGEFETIYDATSAGFQQKTSRSEFLELASAIHRKLGAFRSAERTRVSRSFGSTGSVVGINYKAQYAEGEAKETFTYRMGESQPKLEFYNVNSRVLVVK